MKKMMMKKAWLHKKIIIKILIKKQVKNIKKKKDSPKKKNNDNYTNKKSKGYNDQNDYDNEDNNYYGNNDNYVRRSSQNIRNKDSNRIKKDDRQDDDEDYIKPKKTFQPSKHKHNDEYDRYNKKEMYNNDDNMPIRAKSGIVPQDENYKRSNNYENKFENNKYDNNYAENKKGNSNILNCVISLLKELSLNELQVVKREIDRLNY